VEISTAFINIYPGFLASKERVDNLAWKNSSFFVKLDSNLGIVNKDSYWKLLMLRKIFTGNIWSLKTNK